jgi:hypothetical protein
MESVSFWDVHGIFFLLGLMFFPRITVLFFSAVTAGIWFWIGFLIFPRIFVAVIAILNYWDTNPVLCIFALLCCLGGESAEKTVAANGVRRSRCRGG